MNSAILSLWGVWDYIYQRCSRLQYVEKGRNIFRIVVLRYRGEPLTTTDDRHIRPGDLILKLHLHNYHFAKLCRGMRDETRIVLLLRKHILESLPQLAVFLASLPQVDEIKGVVGTTMIHKGAEPLGFSVSDVPMTWFFRYKRWYLKLMVRLIHPDGKRKLRRFDHSQPLKRVYISKEELFRRYLPTGQPGETNR